MTSLLVLINIYASLRFLRQEQRVDDETVVETSSSSSCPSRAFPLIRFNHTTRSSDAAPLDVSEYMIPEAYDHADYEEDDDDDGSNSNSATTTTATCRYFYTQHRPPFVTHFPHAMQQILRCWSFWSEPANANKTKVLVLPFSFQRRPPLLHLLKRTPTSFMNGIYRDLLRLGVQIVVHKAPKENGRNKKDEIITPTKPSIEYQMRSPADAMALSTAVQQLHHIAPPRRNYCQKHCSSVPNNNNETQQQPQPVIGILNRAPQSRRSFLNIDALAAALRESSFAAANVTVTQFEGADYVDQVRFFATADGVVVSPHGAQLTGLFFLPPCGRVLEVFPPRYYLPDFYGSLADCSGRPYAALALMDDDDDDDDDDGNSTEAANNNSLASSALPHQARNRKNARGAQLCPSPDAVRRAVEPLVREWRACVRSLCRCVRA